MGQNHFLLRKASELFFTQKRGYINFLRRCVVFILNVFYCAIAEHSELSKKKQLSIIKWRGKDKKKIQVLWSAMTEEKITTYGNERKNKAETYLLKLLTSLVVVDDCFLVIFVFVCSHFVIVLLRADKEFFEILSTIPNPVALLS